MSYDVLLPVTVFMLCLSLFLVHRVAVLQNDFLDLRRDASAPANPPRNERAAGQMDKMCKASEPCAPQAAPSPPKMSSTRLKREQGSSRAAPASFLQFTANSDEQPDVRGNIAVIPWTVSVQQGKAISPKENRMVVQEDGYYLVFGQVLFRSPSAVMGHIIQSRGQAGAAATSTELLRCLQEMPAETPSNTCYTAGVVQLRRGDELELVIPSRPRALVSMDADSTFFGVIQLN